MKELRTDDSLQTYWEGSAYTYAAISANPLTRDRASTWRLLLDEIDERAKQQRVCWLEEMSAQAACNEINYRLDLLTEEFHSAKVSELRARNKSWKDRDARASPEFTLYFGSLRPFELIRLALEGQLPHMESWPQKLSQETSPEIQAFGGKFTAIFNEGKLALKSREEARAKTALHRVKEIHSLVERLNKQRLATYTELLQLAQQSGETRAWPEEFFAKTAPAAPNREEARAKSASVLRVLDARKIVVSEEERQKISSTLDIKRLDRWLDAVALIQETPELFL